MPRDAKGREYGFLSRAQASEWPIKGDERMEALRRRCWAVQQHGWRTYALVPGYVVLWVGVSVLVFMIGSFSWIEAVVIAAVATPIVMGAIKGLGSAGSLAAVLLEEGLCPCCGYNLHGVPRGEQNGVVCPECGLAARSEQVRRTAEFAEGAGVKRGSPSSFLRVGGQTQGMVEDATGSEHALTGARLPRLIRLARDADARERLESARREIDRATSTVVAKSLACAGVVAIAGAIIETIGTSNQHNSLTWVLGLAVAAIIVIVFSHISLSQRQRARALLGAQVCVSCTADLSGAAADESGVVACTGCLARWRAEGEGVKRRLVLGARGKETGKRG